MYCLFATILLVYQLGVHVTSVSTSDCGNWVSFGDSCYTASGRIGSAYTWHNANKYCLQRGSQLASVHSEEENLFVSKLASGLHPIIWLGLNSLGEDATRYSWTDGSSLDFTRVNFTAVDIRKGRCAGLDTPGPEKRWLFMHCDTEAAFACKRPAYVKPYTIPPPTATPNPGNCPQGWTRIDNKCFKIFSSADGHKVNHSTARELCFSQGKGHDLAVIHTEEENVILTTLSANEKTNLWIGLSRITFTTFGWTDNTALDFTRWAPGEPSSVAEGCTEFLTTKHRSGLWNDISCRAQMGYICQRYPDLTVTTVTTPTVKCDQEGFQRFGTSCYGVFSGVDQFTWSLAEDFCQKKGGHLASLHKGQELAFLRSQLLQQNQGPVWIGLRRNERGVNTWSDGWPVTYLNLPNAVPEINSTLCGVMSTNGTWNFLDCNSKRGILCKTTDDKRPEYPELDNRPCPKHVSPVFDLGLKHCYTIRSAYLSWGDANLECLRNGSTLASFHSQEELELLSPYIAKAPVGFWIGQIRRYDRDFVWVDGTKSNITFWDNNEPLDKKDSNCVYLLASTLKTKTLECQGRSGYICKISKG